MSAQRYTPDELDEIADEMRDHAITIATKLVTPDRDPSYVVADGARVSAQIALADFLRRDAQFLRRTRTTTRKGD